MLSGATARPLYLATVGHSLALEYTGALSWSVTGFSAQSLATLFDSRSFFSMATAFGFGGYVVVGQVLPAPPMVTYGFMTSNKLIAGTRVATIARVFDWARGSSCNGTTGAGCGMSHYLNGYTAKNAVDHWQYRGLAPVSRILSGTVNYADPERRLRSWTPGCHGTNYFLMSLLRAVNIPVQYVTAAGHATPFFPAEGLYLDHGDDLYNRYVRITTTGETIPSQEYFLTADQWNAWFGAGVPEQTQLSNISRRIVGELVVKYLPDYSLWNRCEDIRLGLSTPQSALASDLSPWYTVADLDALNLWQRLDAKIASLGGCAKIPGLAEAGY
jgi:hypothetical protein